MLNYILDWLDISSLAVDDNIIFLAVILFSALILNFIFDFFRFLMYYITRR